MKEEFHSLLKHALQGGKPGFFHLGKGPFCRKFAFDGSIIRFQASDVLQWFPSSTEVLQRLNHEELNLLLKEWQTGDHTSSNWFSKLPKQAAEDERDLWQALLQDELVNTFCYCKDGFLFERNPNIPSPDDDKSTITITAEELVERSKEMTDSLHDTAYLFPSADEVLIQSSLGQGTTPAVHLWVRNQVFDLIDGFRDLHEIVSDSPFAPHVTWTILADGVKQGTLLKKRFPEFESCHPLTMGTKEQELLLSQVQQSLPLAASPVMLLELIATLYKLLGDHEASLNTQLKIVDTHREAKRQKEAIDVLDQVITNESANPDLAELRHNLVIDLAKQSLSAGDLDQGRRWLREAIDTSDDDQIRLDLIATYKNTSDQIREGTRIATRLYRSGQTRRALRLMDSLEALHPDNEEMQQLRLEFMIDHGELEASEDALTRMASRLAKEGRINRARKVARSLSQLKKSRRETHRNWIPDLLRFLPRFSLLVLFITIVSLVVLAESRLQTLITSAETLSPADWRDDARPWLILMPEGPWKSGLNSAAALVADREKNLVHDYASQKAQLLADARKFRRMGLHERSMEMLKNAERHGALEESKSLQSEWEKEDRQAAFLKSSAEKALSLGDLDATHQYLRKLIQEFPAHDETLNLRLPILIDSDPGTIVSTGGKSLPVPALIEIHPFNATTLQLQKDGKNSEYVITADGPPQRFLPSP